MSAALTSREAVPVRMGEFTLYCEEFKVSGESVNYEQPTVSGTGLFTSRWRKAARLTFSGRIYSSSQPLSAIAGLYNMCRYNAAFSTEYRDLTFTGCYVQSFTAEDSGRDYISLTVNLITNSDIGRKST